MPSVGFTCRGEKNKLGLMLWIDPDNVDAFNDDFDRGGGFTPKLTANDSVVFLRKMAAEAKRYGMSIGLKNAETILPNVTDIIQFAVNEVRASNPFPKIEC